MMAGEKGKRKMFYARIERPDGAVEQNIYFSMAKFHNDTFSPDVNVLNTLDFTIHGKSYAERKDALYNLAVNWSYEEAEEADIGLSWNEIAHVEYFFEKNARRYGLLREFQENAIC